MDNLTNELLKILSTQTGQGNTNTTKLTEAVLKSNPDLDFNRTKIDVVEALRELSNNGQIQIMTVNWELGEEFLYLDSGTKDKIELV
ncbi:MAG: hypothetical protein WBB48_12150 [Thermodesulfobacteriota bacterium]